MCGIVGSIGLGTPERLKRMNQLQYHRGPDEEGVYWDNEAKVGLAMRRLGIVDLTSGSQPMYNEDKSIVIVFNGEIFNAPDLRKKLLQNGHKFVSKNSDTEVIVHLYEEKGKAMLQELNGMFAFLIWDSNKRIVLGARDYAGMKPLYYAKEGQAILFASELKCIVGSGDFKGSLDMQSVSDFLSLQFIPAPRTIYENVKKLGAGEAFVYNVSEEKFDIFQYWSIKESFRNNYFKKNEVKHIIRNELEQAVSRWKMSDVPTACLLSGGIDSAALVGLLSQQGTDRLNTFTLGFENEDGIDERNLASVIAKKYDTNHTEVVISADDLLHELNFMIDALDEPYAGGIPSWYMYKMIGKKYKVAFTGVGGDELFGNYGKWIRYENIVARLQCYLKELKRGAGVAELLEHPYGSIYHKYIPEKMKQQILLKHGGQKYFSVNERYELLLKDKEVDTWKNVIPYIDFGMQLPDEFLFMTDRFSMAHSVEARTPFLDKNFIQTVFSIEPNVRTNSKMLKETFIEAVKDILPQEIINAPKKGFVIPYQRWMRNNMKELVSYYFSEEFLIKQGIFEKNMRETLLEPFMKGKSQYTPFIWNIFMFQLWYDTHKVYIK